MYYSITQCIHIVLHGITQYYALYYPQAMMCFQPMGNAKFSCQGVRGLVNWKYIRFIDVSDQLGRSSEHNSYYSQAQIKQLECQLADHGIRYWWHQIFTEMDIINTMQTANSTRYIQTSSNKMVNFDGDFQNKSFFFLPKCNCATLPLIFQMQLCYSSS